MTSMGDLPDEILHQIISLITPTRSRNSIALVSRKFHRLERLTRTVLTLRGNLRDLHLIPPSFPFVTRLDLSLLSPWGHPLTPSPEVSFPFPSVTVLSLYIRTATTLSLLLPRFPRLTHLKLVRYHQRPSGGEFGADFAPLAGVCGRIVSLDLSAFYCWTEDVVSAVGMFRGVEELDLLNPSLAEGYKADQIKTVTSFCMNLKVLKVPCMFDHRIPYMFLLKRVPNYRTADNLAASMQLFNKLLLYIGFVDDDCLLALSSNCPNLHTLHLVDTSALLATRADADDEGYSPDDAAIGTASLIDMFSALPLLEDLVLDVSSNIRDSKVILEHLGSKCPRLKTLKLGHFHGVCTANDSNLGSKLDGIAICKNLESLSIKNSADLTDFGLVAIAKGCSRLAKFEIEGCKGVTVKGMRLFASLLCRSLVDVRISCCKNLGAVSSLKALEPIQDRIVRLHIDCVWNSVEHFDTGFNFDLNQENCEMENEEMVRMSKRCKYDEEINCSYSEVFENGYQERTWDRLEYLSLWISVGEVLTPLINTGLENCPVLEEIEIKIEGDSRDHPRPSQPAFGLSSLSLYPSLTKLCLICRDTIGYAHTAPSGQTDLSLWERFFLNGIGSLSLSELDYWPPQDRDVNQRSLSLPGAGLLGECTSLRKLIIHGTAHEHFMMILLRVPKAYLRDVQLREDYYPAPEDDMSTEMRENSCSRFETALNTRHILD